MLKDFQLFCFGRKYVTEMMSLQALLGPPVESSLLLHTNPISAFSAPSIKLNTISLVISGATEPYCSFC